MKLLLKIMKSKSSTYVSLKYLNFDFKSSSICGEKNKTALYTHANWKGEKKKKTIR